MRGRNRDLEDACSGQMALVPFSPANNTIMLAAGNGQFCYSRKYSFHWQAILWAQSYKRSDILLKYMKTRRKHIHIGQSMM